MQSRFNLKDAVFITENAYFDNKLPRDDYEKKINEKVKLCRKLMKREKLDTTNKLSKNYAIQKLFTDTIIEKRKDGTLKKTFPITYDFKDYRGDEDWKKMFVTKVLSDNSGQCHSLPLFAKIVADELNTKAYLSYAPDHLYLQFTNKNGKPYSFETTNGYNTSMSWVMQSGYISSIALKNHLYMDTLTDVQMLSLCLVDLAHGYIAQYGPDEFALNCAETALRLDPKNIHALLLTSDLQTINAKQALAFFGIKKPEQINSNPTVKQIFDKRNFYYQMIDESGYQAMPKEAYETWLKSLKEEEQKQEDKKINNLILQEIKQKN